MITYSTEITVNRSTTTSPRREIVSIVEATQGAEEFNTIAVIAAGAEVTFATGHMTVIKTLIVDGKTNGGVENVDLLVLVTPKARTGVTAAPQEIPVGSRLVLADTQLTLVTVKNLGPVPVEVAVTAIGD